MQQRALTVVMVATYFPYVYIYFVYLFIFIVQWVNRRQIVAICNEFIVLLQLMGTGQNLAWILRAVLIKHLVLFVKVVLLVIYLSVIVSSDKDWRMWATVTYWAYIQLVIDAITCGYHYVLTVFSKLFQNLNGNLKSDLGFTVDTILHSRRNISRMCIVSDDIDRIIVLHCRLCNIFKEINILYEKQILVSMISRFFHVLIHVYIAYYTYNTADFDVVAFLYSLCGLSDTLIMSKTCDDLLKHSFLLSDCIAKSSTYNDLDVRLEQTIEMASFVLLFKFTRTSVCGLYNISLGIFLPVLSAFTSYLFILIQFASYDQ
ncbi:uncharacterized protein LOC119648573 [Hermetia illucens]|uniref:uncharacterized protein LOC119648573 n=1 Tax=Hermetia illucens TaxID=343691 RepID=UPI0018CC1625|nr:uncharacterized protein LOC119648573 [Hermetia illucens]